MPFFNLIQKQNLNDTDSGTHDADDAEIGSIMDVDNDDMTSGQEERVSSSTTTMAASTVTTTISNAHERSTATPKTTTLNPSPQLSAAKMPDGPPNEWTIEEVIQYISGTDSALAVHADLFRKHVSSHHTFPSSFFRIHFDFRFFSPKGN